MRRPFRIIVSFMLVLLAGCQNFPLTASLGINVSGSGRVVRFPGTNSFLVNSEVLLTAIPDEGHTFAGWTGDVVSRQNPITVTVHGDLAITAAFAPESPVAGYRLSAGWESYRKADLLVNANTTAAARSAGRKSPGAVRTKDYFGLDTRKADRRRAILVKYKGIRNLGTTLPFERIPVDPGKYPEIPAMLSALRAMPNVEYAEEDAVYKALYVPDDAWYSWQWNFTDLGMEAAWDVTMGEDGVIVAVIDSGVYFPLADLERTKFVQGYDFINNRATPFDDNGHGSHVIGTIAQSTGNGRGVAGMAPNVKIMPIKALGADGFGNVSFIAEAIYFAVHNGAHIINMSLGGDYSEVVHEACAYAASHGVLLIAAAGNDGESSLLHPAGDEHVLSVGATNDIRQLAYYSNRGTGIDLVAPGGDFSRPLPGTSIEEGIPAGILQESRVGDLTWYFLMQGTSMAAPHVAGLAALLKSKNMNLDAARIESILKGTADDLGVPGYDTTYGHGLINPVRALGIPGYIRQDSVSSSLPAGTGATEKWKLYAAPSTITATLSLANDDPAFSLRLEDPAGNLIGTGTRAGDTISLRHTVSPDAKGEYRLVVGYGLAAAGTD